MDTSLERITRPAQIESLPALLEFVHRGAQASLTESDINKLDLVLEELLVNVARHAYPDAAKGDVELSYALEGPDTIRVRISDTGRPFNPLDSNPPDFSPGLADRQLGGLGIFLVKSIAESITYEREPDHNTVSFIFRGDKDKEG